MSSETETGTKFCSNCKKDIAEANFMVHEVHCLRHLVLCEHCQEPIPRSERDQHFNDVHAKTPCTLCGVEMERDHIDGHVETTCPKRKVACQFCELEMAQDEMKGHVEYCGTRTEPCKKCGAFILLRDQLRHTSSNCTYPEPEPAAPSKPSVPYPLLFSRGPFNKSGPAAAYHRNHEGPFLFTDTEDHLSAFNFDSMLQELGQEDYSHMPSMVVEDSDASAAAPAVPAVDHTRRVHGLRKVADASRAANVTGQRQDAFSNSQKGLLNRHREREGAIPPDVDYDTVLAQQLAAEIDEDPDADLNRLLRNYEKHPRAARQIVSLSDDVVEPASPPTHHEFAAADDVMIPCEFCGETFPDYALVHHQSVCDPLASGLWGDHENVPYQRNRNNELSEDNWRPIGIHATIPVINNLAPASPAHHSEELESHQIFDDGDHDKYSLENLMLPCEFCKDLLPADVLPHHQALCEVHQFSIPDSWMPAAAQPTGSVLSHRNHFFPTSGVNSRQRHQPDPTEELLSVISRQDAKANQKLTERVQPSLSSQARPKKQPNVPGMQPDWDPTAGRSPKSGPSSRIKPQQNRRISNRADSAEPEDFSLHDRRGSRSGQSGTKTSSRTQNTLNTLLAMDDDMIPDHQLQEGGARHSYGSASKQSWSSGSSGVSARTVVKNMEQENRRNLHSHRMVTDHDSAVRSETDDAGTLDGQRERGDRVFNNTSSTRRQQNRTRTRRPPSRQLQPEWE